MAKEREDLTGKIFGRWKVIGPAEDYIRPDGYHEPKWLCECSCENHTRKAVRQCRLKGGQSKSCGCLSRESTSARFKKHNEYSELLKDEHGEYYKVKFTNKDGYFLVDADDWEAAKEYSWMLTINPEGYKSVKGNIDGKLIKLTAFIGCKYYDHIDRNSLNNRKYNLRPATTQENNRNHSKNKKNTSGFTGVYWNKANEKWCSNIKVNNKTIYLGSFNLIDDAVRARKEAEQKFFGEFAPKEVSG